MMPMLEKVIAQKRTFQLSIGRTEKEFRYRQRKGVFSSPR